MCECWVSPVETDGIGPRGRKPKVRGVGSPKAFSSIPEGSEWEASVSAARPVGKGRDSLRSYLLDLSLSSLNNGMVIGRQ